MKTLRTTSMNRRASRIGLILPALLGLAGVWSSGAAQARKPTVSLPGGPPGTEVTVRIGGLPPEVPIILGFGALNAQHELVADTITDAQGVLDLTLPIPDWAFVNRNHFFFLTWADQRPWGFSDPFLVTGPDAAVRLRGEVAAGESEGCTVLQLSDETRYALRADAERMALLKAGQRVIVDGTLMPFDIERREGSACSGLVLIQVRAVTTG